MGHEAQVDWEATAAQSARARLGKARWRRTRGTSWLGAEWRRYDDLIEWKGGSCTTHPRVAGGFGVGATRLGPEIQSQWRSRGTEKAREWKTGTGSRRQECKRGRTGQEREQAVLDQDLR